MLLFLLFSWCCTPSYGNDMTYIATQNFLIDLPLREDSFANQVASAFLTLKLPEYNNNYPENPCNDIFFLHGDTRLWDRANDAQHVAERQATVLWQRAGIEPGNVSTTGSVGTVTLATEIYFNLPVWVKAQCHICIQKCASLTPL